MSCSKPLAAVVDLDRTVADTSAYEHHVQGGRRNFDRFHGNSHRFGVHRDTLAEVLGLRKRGVHLYFLTGRSDKFRAETRLWLDKHVGAPYSLRMKRERDRGEKFAKAAAYKKKVLAEEIAPHFEVVAFYDDDATVIEAVRAQCAGARLVVHGAAGASRAEEEEEE